MESEDLNDLEQCADRLLETVLALEQAELDAIYNSARPGQSARKIMMELADRAAALCENEQRPKPPQLKTALEGLAQLELPFEIKATPTKPHLLLIDRDADRLLSRRELFLEMNIDIAVTASLLDGLGRLELGGFQLVIIDYVAVGEKERHAMARIQEFNVQAPVINIQAWATFLRAEDRRINRDLLRAVAKLFKLKPPKRLPPKRPAIAAKSPEQLKVELLRYLEG
jgi:hypothetical protein